MSPSHPDRVRRAYCPHLKMNHGLCLACGAKVSYTSYEWVEDGDYGSHWHLKEKK